MSGTERKQGAASRLHGRRVLIVEDEYMLASDLARGFAKAGIDIVGPTGSLAKAIQLLKDGGVDGAVLDIKLSDKQVYPLADTLIERGTPIVFVTGYDAGAIPARFSGVPLCEKPVDTLKVIEALSRAFE